MKCIYDKCYVKLKNLKIQTLFDTMNRMTKVHKKEKVLLYGYECN